MILTTFSLTYWRMMDKLVFCMFKILMTNLSSFCFVNTPWRPNFLVLVLPLRLFNSEVKRIFQYVLTFLKGICFHSTTSMASSTCWTIYFAMFRYNRQPLIPPFCICSCCGRIGLMFLWCCGRLGLPYFLCC